MIGNRASSLVALCVATLGVAMTPAVTEAQVEPDRPGLALELGAGAGFRTTTSATYDLFADTARPLWGGFSLGMRGDAGWTAALEYQRWATSSEPFGGLSWAALRVQTGTLRGTYRFSDVPYVQPYLSLAAGLAVGNVEVDAESRYTDQAVGMDLHIAAGVEALSTGWVRVGGYTDLGYAWHSGLNFDDLRTSGFGRPVSLGVVRNGGLAWRIGVRVVVPLARRPVAAAELRPDPIAAPAPTPAPATEPAPAPEPAPEPEAAASEKPMAGESEQGEAESDEDEPAEPQVVLPESIELQLEERPGPVVPRPGPPPVP